MWCVEPKTHRVFQMVTGLRRQMSRSPKRALFSSAHEVPILAERRTCRKRLKFHEVASALFQRYFGLQRIRKRLMRRNQCLRSYRFPFNTTSVQQGACQPERLNLRQALLRSYGDRLRSSVPTNLNLSRVDLSLSGCRSSRVRPVFES